MNSYDKFEQIYEKLVENSAENLESLRFGAKNETIRNIIIITILIVFGFALNSFLYKILYPNDEIAHFVILIYISVAFLIYIIIKPNGKKSKINQYKRI